MLEHLASVCSAPDCERTLSEDRRMLTMETPDGTRRAYECECGAVTVTVLSDEQTRTQQ
ncbi:hypothetical protein [Salinarchaeum laminariae]|uniref:hypothetical protein n=1 Tax=Salinarchaeum laminariae TaxID=869888 RepID=UPI0020BFB5DD|nr:hypothetical protein [Salinarchaeum laminariae]